MLIRKFFFRLRKRWMYTSRYTQSSPTDHARVSYYCCVICVISLFPRFKTQRKWRYRQLYIIILYKTDKIKTRNKLRFSKHKIIRAKSQILQHTYINTIYYYFCIERIYRKEKQRVSSHRKTNSCLLNFKKFIDTNSSTLYKIYYY